MTLYVTSDTHFGHQLVARKRGFTLGNGDADVDGHDQAIVRNWNSRVHPADSVWLLGDMTLTSPSRVWWLVDQLNGVKHLVAGNHDAVFPGHRDAHKHQKDYLEHFESVQPYARRRVEGEDVLLSHFPYRGDHTETERSTQWRLPDEGKWLLHGHTHSVSRYDGHHSIHVGLDAWGLTPVSLDEIGSMIRAVKAASELSRVGEEIGA